MRACWAVMFRVLLSPCCTHLQLDTRREKENSSMFISTAALVWIHFFCQYWNYSQLDDWAGVAQFFFCFPLSDAIVLCLPMEFRVSGADNEARREGDTKDGPRVARQMVITCNERAHSAHRLSFEEARKKKKKKIDVYTLSKRQGETMGIEMWEGSSSSFSLWRMLTYHLCLFFFFFFFKLVAFIFFSGVFLILLSAGLLRGSPPNVKVDKMVGALAKKKQQREGNHTKIVYNMK